MFRKLLRSPGDGRAPKPGWFPIPGRAPAPGRLPAPGRFPAAGKLLTPGRGPPAGNPPGLGRLIDGDAGRETDGDRPTAGLGRLGIPPPLENPPPPPRPPPIPRASAALNVSDMTVNTMSCIWSNFFISGFLISVPVVGMKAICSFMKRRSDSSRLQTRTGTPLTPPHLTAACSSFS